MTSAGLLVPNFDEIVQKEGDPPLMNTMYPSLPYAQHDNINFQDEFKRVITLVEDAILATDLAVYFRRRNETFEKMSSNTLEWTTEDKDR